MTSLGLDVFEVLCACANQIERLREDCREGTDAWLALTQVVDAIDVIIDAVVDGPAIEEEH